MTLNLATLKCKVKTKPCLLLLFLYESFIMNPTTIFVLILHIQQICHIWMFRYFTLCLFMRIIGVNNFLPSNRNHSIITILHEMSNSSKCKTWPFQLSVCPIVDIIIQLADPISDSKLEPPDKKCPRAQDLMLIHFKFGYLANLSSEKSISTTFFQKWISGHNF